MYSGYRISAANMIHMSENFERNGEFMLMNQKSMPTLDLSVHLLQVPNNTHMLRSQTLIDWSLFSHRYCKLIG